MGEARGKRIGGASPLSLPTKGELLTLDTEELYGMSQDQLLDLASQIVLAPGVDPTSAVDKRQLLCRILQSATQII